MQRKKDVEEIHKLLENGQMLEKPPSQKRQKVEAAVFDSEDVALDAKPIGFVQSWYKTKNGTPRQPTVTKLLYLQTGNVKLV